MSLPSVASKACPSSQVLQELCSVARAAREALSSKSAAPAKQRVHELCAQASRLPVDELSTGDLVNVLQVCGCHGRTSLWHNASALLPARLATADGRCVAEVARGYSWNRVQDQTVKRAVVDRAAALASARDDSGTLSASDTARLLRTLGWFLGNDTGYSKHNVGVANTQRPYSHLGFNLASRLIGHKKDLSLVDVVRSCEGLLQLGADCSGVLQEAQGEILRLLESMQDTSDLDPRMVVKLLKMYHRAGLRDDVVVRMAVDALASCCARGQPVGIEDLPVLIWVVACKLGPPPVSLARVVEACLPQMASSLQLHSLALVLRGLPHVSGLQSEKRGLGSAVFAACLAAPLAALTPRALTDAMRSAWALGHTDPDFWVSALCEAEAKILSLGASSGSSINSDGWDLKDLAGVALAGSRLISSTRAATTGQAPADAFPVLQGPPMRVALPAAERLVRMAVKAATVRVFALTPHQIGTLSISLAKAGIDEGQEFAMLAHRALELLKEGEKGIGLAKFGPKDVAQLLAGLAHFQFRDEPLLSALASCIEVDLDSYDEVGRDIVLWSFSKLGGLPSGQELPRLDDALLEYDLARGHATSRSESHFVSMEVLPA